MQFAIEHIGLAARDTMGLCDWYRRVLGAELVFANSETPPAFLLRLDGEVMIEIYPSHLSREETSNNRLSGWRHLALKVDSIEAARDRLTGAGVIFEEPIKPAGGGGRVLFFSDAEGNLLHLVERPPGVAWPPAPRP
jgi:catechol 2,3-dioxygenase-like lactoylglutathione lyase family enzyme